MPGIAANIDLEQVLARHFQLTSFRGRQRAVIEAVLAGRDTLAVLPTGAGKSLCYQLPALLLEGLVLVVSPLIALMRDQERRLQALGIAARALTGRQTPAQRHELGQALQRRALRILLLSPERLLADGYLAWLAAICGEPGIALLVVDEAHCIADWGVDFRPAYSALVRVRVAFPRLQVLALTASADQRVRDLIVASLAMRNAAVIQSSFDRPELFYRVFHTPAPRLTALHYLHCHHPASAAVFYCRRRRESELMAALLTQHGLAARAYHAGLPAESRHRAEQWFAQTPAALVAATIAFGMGIDKPDIRLVVHLGASASLAAYYQESGRAGRDGRAADALLLLAGGPHPPDVAAAGGAMCTDPADPAAALDRYIHSPGCRRVALLAAFGEIYAAPCGFCDRCAPDYRVPGLPRSSTLMWVPKPAVRQPRTGAAPARRRG